MIYAYINSIDNVEEKLNDPKLKDVKKENIFVENKRISKLEGLLKLMKKDDILIIPNLIEIPKMEDLCKLIQEASQIKIKLILDEKEFDFSQIENNRKLEGILEVTSILLENRKKVIQNRIKKGMEQARSRGVKIGRHRMTLETIPNIVKENYPLYENNYIGINELARKCNMSRARIVTYVKFFEEEKEKKNEKDV
ncbi:hypothetical protein [Clostridium butyricum]|uniref:hypothetical protein n=1 Tax=Clostridium butyricum TaxID=1492 RepID=UPI0022E4485B|nr:hypothetical protein [Clostridium butyricum]MDU3597553.1 hypothetical protein [Clostridium butyricum]